MANSTSPSRFASPAPRRAVPEKLEDFGMISLDTVEKMLRDTTEGDSRPLGNDYIPPPIFDGTSTTPAPRVAAPVATTAPNVQQKPAAPRFRFADMVKPDGSVDTDAVYRYGQIPTVQLSAELLLQALSNLPPDIPVEARQIALKVTVNSLTQAVGIPVESVIADALLRHTRLSQFRDALAAESDRENKPLRRSVQEIETAITTRQAQLAAVCAEIETREAAAKVTHDDCDKHMTQLIEVLDALRGDGEAAPGVVSYQ